MPPSTTTSSPPWAYITYAAPEFRVPHAYESRAAQSSAIGGVGMSSLTGVEHSYVGPLFTRDGRRTRMGNCPGLARNKEEETQK
ncbi:unnamed protein product [Lactuca virosa]|uniref:Uncharacterized protein n=1 Tax=Lactuca virosa TaxID=75947 RepID=A0AAU9NXH8_9ASTR|nr:unnamed protein product [Lactuca virosa]